MRRADHEYRLVNATGVDDKDVTSGGHDRLTVGVLFTRGSVGIYLAWHASTLIPAATPVLLGVVAEVEGRLHERDMAERLRHITDKSAVARIILLTQQADIVTQGEQPFEQFDGLLPPPLSSSALASQKLQARKAPSEPASPSTAEVPPAGSS